MNDKVDGDSMYQEGVSDFNFFYIVQNSDLRLGTCNFAFESKMRLKLNSTDLNDKLVPCTLISKPY